MFINIIKISFLSFEFLGLKFSQLKLIAKILDHSSSLMWSKVFVKLALDNTLDFPFRA